MDGICEASPEGTCYRHLYEDQAIDILEIVVEECVKVAEEAVQSCREDGETDLRSVRHRVNSAIRELKRTKQL